MFLRHPTFFVAFSAVFVAAVALPAPSARAQTETQCAASDTDDDVDLDTPRGFSLPDVKVTRKRLTITNKNGATPAKAEMECKFKNTGANAVRFLICQMISPKNAAKGNRNVTFCQLFKDNTTTPPTIRCRNNGQQQLSTREGAHFSCLNVLIAAGAEVSINPDPINDNYFDGKKASDFQVNYVDIVDLRGADGVGHAYDGGANDDDLRWSDTNCCRGVDAFYDLDQDGADAIGGIGGIWAMWHQPWVDPYSWYQPIGGPPTQRELFYYEHIFSLPSNFPLTGVAGLPRLPSGGYPLPPSMSVDIHLFDWVTMSGGAGDTQAWYEVHHDGTGGFRTDPAPGVQIPYMIPGGAMPIETMDVLPPDVCPLEGTTVALDITTYDANTGRPIIRQAGKFINDNYPPVGETATHEFRQGGIMHVEVTAHDDTTYPLGAILWYTLDGGAHWRTRPMTPLGEPDQDHQQMAFAVDVTHEGAPQITYFFTVQDEVLNILWYGPAQAGAPPVPAADARGIALLGALLIASACAVLLLRRRRRRLAA